MNKLEIRELLEEEAFKVNELAATAGSKKDQKKLKVFIDGQ